MLYLQSLSPGQSGTQCDSCGPSANGFSGYLDAICIVQDDKEQMSQDISNMDIIYGKAFATIVALIGEDADGGLPGVSPGTRAPQQIESVIVSDKSPDLDHDPECGSNETVCLVATPRPLYLILEDSRWNSRG